MCLITALELEEFQSYAWPHLGCVLTLGTPRFEDDSHCKLFSTTPFCFGHIMTKWIGGLWDTRQVHDHANPLSAGASSTSGQGTDPPADGCHVWALFPRYIVFLLVFIATHKWGLILPADGLSCAATSFLRCLPPATLLVTHTTQVKRHFRCQSCTCQNKSSRSDI